ncbi:hypothetical protein AB9L17_00070 (plasmid) [Bacillus sp. RS11]
MKKNLIKLVFILSISMSSLAFFAQESKATYIDTLTKSYIEYVSPRYYVGDYEYITLTYVNGYTTSEKITQLESLAGQLLGRSTLKHSFTYTTY